MAEPENVYPLPDLDIVELLARAAQFETDPHKLFLWILALAMKYEPDVRTRVKIVRLMAEAAMKTIEVL